MAGDGPQAEIGQEAYTFTGPYCPTVDNTAGGSASWTLAATDSVESDD